MLARSRLRCRVVCRVCVLSFSCVLSMSCVLSCVLLRVTDERLIRANCWARAGCVARVRDVKSIRRGGGLCGVAIRRVLIPFLKKRKKKLLRKRKKEKKEKNPQSRVYRSRFIYSVYKNALIFVLSAFFVLR